MLCRSNNAKGNLKGDDPAEMERQLEVLKVRPTASHLHHRPPLTNNPGCSKAWKSRTFCKHGPADKDSQRRGAVKERGRESGGRG